MTRKLWLGGKLHIGNKYFFRDHFKILKIKEEIERCVLDLEQ